MDRSFSRRTAISTALAVAWSTGRSAAASQDDPGPTRGSAPMFRGNPARTGEHPGPGPFGRPSRLWITRLGTRIRSTPAVVDGVMYVGSAAPSTMVGGALHAVDAATGLEIWRLETATGDAILSSPAVHDGLVYAGSYDGIIVAAEAATGAERWRFQAEGAIYSSPAVADGQIYVGDDAGRLYALDALSGEEQWRLATDDPFLRAINASPTVVDGTVYIVNAARHLSETSSLHALASDTGEERWRFVADDGNVRSTVAFAAGRIHVSTVEGMLYALDPLDAREQWRFDGEGEPQSLIGVSEGLVLFAVSGGRLHAVDAATGHSPWSRVLESGAEIVASPVVAQGVGYFGDAGGVLHAVDLATGTEQWQYRVGRQFTSPVVLDGVIYLGSENGGLGALGGSPDPDLTRR
jgi:eukaryotic-like serine/threonine-protein kinase